MSGFVNTVCYYEGRGEGSSTEKNRPPHRRAPVTSSPAPDEADLDACRRVLAALIARPELCDATVALAAQDQQREQGISLAALERATTNSN